MTVKKAVRIIRSVRNGNCVIKTARDERILTKLETGNGIPTENDFRIAAEILQVPAEVFTTITRKQFYLVSNPKVAKIMQSLNQIAATEKELLGVLDGTD